MECESKENQKKCSDYELSYVRNDPGCAYYNKFSGACMRPDKEIDRRTKEE